MHIAQLCYAAFMELSPDALDRVLTALAEQLLADGAAFELVVIGGSALLALGHATRTTKDVDVVALAEDGALRIARPLPEPLEQAAARVMRDFGLPGGWLNTGPTDLLRWGLPEGFWERTVVRHYGPALTVRFAGRRDQVHFKLYAAVDRSGGRHEADLRALPPTDEELVAAAKWSIGHDPSPGYRALLEQALTQLGVDDVDLDA